MRMLYKVARLPPVGICLYSFDLGKQIAESGTSRRGRGA